MGKDIIFYSNFCRYSKEILTTVTKSKLNDLLTFICVDDKNIQLPPFLTAVPTIYIANEKKIIMDENIQDWIKSKQNSGNDGLLDSYFSESSNFSASFSNLDDSEDKSFVSDFTYLDQPIDSINTPQEISGDKNKDNDVSKSYEDLQNSRTMSNNTRQGGQFRMG
tara:strand:- start:127 stop:621 length:495 start_codon:yes stop_codon:yes gene_type:complete